MARRSAATSARPRGVPAVSLGLLGLGAGSVVAHNARQVLVLRKRAAALRVALDHDRFVGDGVGEPTHLWVLGDSASDGYGLADAADAFPFHVASQLSAATSRGVKLTSLGRDGARLADVTDEQVPMLGQGADVVAVLVGANDVFGRRRGEQVTGDAAVMLAAIVQRARSATVVVAGCPDFGKAGGFPQPLRLVLGWRCRVTSKAIGRACRDADIPFVDIVSASRPELFGEDGVHPSREGSELIASGVLAAMLQAGQAIVDRGTIRRR
jgi:lysophospholipase L1-like esterase